MICTNCGQDSAYMRETTKAFGKGDNLVVIENVPVKRCRNCSVELLTDATMQQLEKLIHYLRADPAGRASGQLVRVAEFQEDPAIVQARIAEHRTEASLQAV